MTTETLKCTPATLGQRIELPLADLPFQDGFYLPLNDVLLATTGGGPVIANGNIAMSWVDSQFEGSVDANDQPGPARARIGLDGVVTLEFALDAGAEVADSLRLALVALPPLVIEPITVSPFVQVAVHVAATADAAGVVSVVAPFHIGSGFSFDGSSRAGLTRQPRFAPEVGFPDTTGSITAQIDVETVLALMMSINDIPLGGPVLGPSLGVLLEVDSATGFDLDGRVRIVGGWAFPDPLNFGFPSIPEDLETLVEPVRFDIADVAGPLEVGLTSTRWSRQYAVDGAEHGRALVPQADGLALVGGSPGLPWLTSLDDLGVPRWQIQVDAWSPAAAVEATHGDIVVAGTSGGDIRVDRFTPAGDPAWTRTLAGTDADSVTCVAMVPTASNGVILTGHVNRSSTLTPLLIALDENGDVSWSIEVDMGSGSSDPKIVALAEDPTGGFVAAGQVNFTELTDPTEPPISGTNAVVVKFSDQGVLDAAFALGSGGTIPVTEFARQVVVGPDGSYVIGGHFGVAPNIWLASVDADDALVWSARYRARPDTDTSIDIANLRGLTPTADGGVAMCGVIGVPDTDAWLMRVNDAGMPLWAKCYSTIDLADELVGVVTLEDGFAAFGRKVTVSGVDSDPWVVRTNVDGMVHFTETSGVVTENTPVEWQHVADHTLRALAPVATPLALSVDSSETLVATSAAGFGQLLTE